MFQELELKLIYVLLICTGCLLMNSFKKAHDCFLLFSDRLERARTGMKSNALMGLTVEELNSFHGLSFSVSSVLLIIFYANEVGYQMRHFHLTLESFLYFFIRHLNRNIQIRSWTD